MVSINTNLSSLITQRSMLNSTNRLNSAIEKLSTGYKINHAGDNAANYSISTDMNTQLSSYDIASDNIAMGMDLLSTAQDTIAGMQDRASRIHALVTQARNGTYGASSLAAMSQEANAIISEINRLYMNTEYNGKKLLEVPPLPEWAQEAGTIDGKSLEQCATEHNGFISEVVADTPQVVVTDPTQLATELESSKTRIGIGNAETFAELANLVNGTSTISPGVTQNCSGKTIILTSDVDLTSICAANTDSEGNGGWNPIGNSLKPFRGTFNGNGHKVTGVYIKRTDADYQGLFGYTYGQIKNVGVEGVDITGANETGGLVGNARGAITNSYAMGNVTGSRAGGLVGYAICNITDCYTNVFVIGSYDAGGLVGAYFSSNGNSSAIASIKNCYATGNVKGGRRAGGLVGSAASSNKSIINSYATGDVTGTGTSNYSNTGGLFGGVSGFPAFSISNSYATGNVTGKGDCTGGLVGKTTGSITNSYATGNVSGTEWVGGLVGQYSQTSGAVTNENILSAGNVSGSDKVGSLIGGIANTTNGTSFDTLNITNAIARACGDMIGFEGNSSGTAYESGQMETWLENIQAMNLDTTLQVGINGSSDSQIVVDTTLNFNLSISDLTSDNAYNSLTSFMDKLSQKSTEIGAAQNRLESALESTLVSMDNLTSSLSTIRDADISKVSSEFIRQQILQQACATLMSTANQSPAIALQLI